MRPVHVLLFALFSGGLPAQSPYRPFPEGDAAWAEYHASLISDGGIGDNYMYCDRVIDFAADTVVGGITYHRLQTRGLCTIQEITPPYNNWQETDPPQILCLFRQDTVARQVLVYDPNVDAEVLWYDFTLSVGDYPITWDQPGVGAVQVLALDSMELNDGWHRTWVLGMQYLGVVTDSAFCTIIEGVGSTYGLQAVHGLLPPFEAGDALTCHSRNNVPVYPFGSAECDISMGGAFAHARPVRVSVFPNPATDRLTVSGLSTSNAQYQLVDIMGSVVQQGALTQGSIDIGAIAPALYFLHVMDGSAEHVVVRVLKSQ
jgi:hypothetical protein